MDETGKQHEWILEGIDCANCAAKIEKGVGRVAGVTDSQVNFMTKTLRFNVAGEKEREVLPQVVRTIQQLEPEVTPLLKKNGQQIGKDGSIAMRTGEYGSHSQGSHVHDHEHGHNPHGHDHTHGVAAGETRQALLRVIFTLFLMMVAQFAGLPAVWALGLYVAAYLLVGGEVVWRAGQNLFHGQVFDENFLMTIATLSAFYIGEYPEAVAVMLFYQIGELFQGIAVNKSRRSIAELMDIRPDYANLLGADGSSQQVSPEEIHVGDRILIRPGEKIPLDGTIRKGSSAVDTAALTGESLPRKVSEGEQVLSGFVNQGGVLEVEVQKTFSESTVSKILELVENASSRKAPTENFITKFARYYTPIVVGLALLLAVLPPLFLEGATFEEWLYRASIFLVISCPCALVVSIPVGFFGGIGAASRKGILVKGGNYLEGLNDVKTVVLDKTGTLTKGKFEVTAIHPAVGYDETQLLELAALTELHSSHPIAESIKAAWGKELAAGRVTDYRELAGHGITARVDGRSVLAGNAALLHTYNVCFEERDEAATVVYLAVDGKWAGALLIADTLKRDAVEAVAQLKQAGIERIVMLTGDSQAVAGAVAKEAGIKEVHAELLPQDKVAKLEEILQQKGAKEKVAFVGDGINDTPVLARADIGFAMGALGSDAAIEAADIVLMDDQPTKIATSMQVAKETRKIVWQNIFFAMVVKGLFLILGAFGIATMWEAVFADVGVTVLAVLNSMRILKK